MLLPQVNVCCLPQQQVHECKDRRTPTMTHWTHVPHISNCQHLHIMGAWKLCEWSECWTCCEDASSPSSLVHTLGDCVMGETLGMNGGVAFKVTFGLFLLFFYDCTFWQSPLLDSSCFSSSSPAVHVNLHTSRVSCTSCKLCLLR